MDHEECCFHCNEPFEDIRLDYDEKTFCCNACLTVYQLLNKHQLGEYYTHDERAGIRPNTTSSALFESLDDPTIREKFYTFRDGSKVKIVLHLPQIHCASCIYLLEHLNQLNDGINFSLVDFPKRLATIVFDEEKCSLKELATLLTKIGYQPDFSHKIESTMKLNKRLLFQLGFAGFAFGSIMLWSFPEYLGIDKTYTGIRKFSSYLSLLVSIPVLFYSAQDYFKAAWGGIRAKRINLDIPIAIGIIALYTRSVFAIFMNEGPGYMDSFAGFIFFLLIGKWFQSKTYRWLSFERDFKSYFPIAVLKKKGSKNEMTPIEELEIDDIILIRNEEIIPTDATLLSEKATIDYSFVTGEADWIEKEKGELIYAGGKVVGTGIELLVRRTTSRSELTQLWNEQESQQVDSEFTIRQDRISRYFLWIVLAIALGSTIAWWFIAPRMIPEIVTAILIVACPCALALSGPFTFGNMQRMLGKRGFYLRNTTVIEKMQNCDTLVFDKTGTLTSTENVSCKYTGKALDQDRVALIAAITEHATHPYAKQICVWAKSQLGENDIPTIETKEIIEWSGKGMEFNTIRIGSHAWLSKDEDLTNEEASSLLEWDGELIGKFIFGNELRNGIVSSIQELGKHYQLIVLSGDNDSEKAHLEQLFPTGTQYHFNQKPIDKKRFIEQTLEKTKGVIMIGDGLNDAGALQAASIGIAVSENLVRFTPASDAILEANQLKNFERFMEYVRNGKKFIAVSFVFSLMYNLTGLGFAISGSLTPFVAAVIMPLSSITVVGLSTFMAISRAPKIK